MTIQPASQPKCCFRGWLVAQSERMEHRITFNETKSWIENYFYKNVSCVHYYYYCHCCEHNQITCDSISISVQTSCHCLPLQDLGQPYPGRCKEVPTFNSIFNGQGGWKKKTRRKESAGRKNAETRQENASSKCFTFFLPLITLLLWKFHNQNLISLQFV